jgi:hypothetical protein
MRLLLAAAAHTRIHRIFAAATALASLAAFTFFRSERTDAAKSQSERNRKLLGARSVKKNRDHIRGVTAAATATTAATLFLSSHCCFSLK